MTGPTVAERAGIRSGDLPSLGAACALLAKSGEPSPLAEMVVVIGQLAEGCIGDPAPWRHAVDAWARVCDTVGATLDDVATERSGVAARWQDGGAADFDAFAASLAGRMETLRDLAGAVSGSARELYDGFLDGRIRFIAVTVAAAAQAQFAAVHADPATQVLLRTTVISEWLAETTRIVAQALADCDRVIGQRTPVANAFDLLKQRWLEQAGEPVGIGDPRRWNLA